MMFATGRWTGWLASLKRGWTDDCASQVVELALSLPLLVFFVVGIFDFSGALTLKQKLTNAAREGARASAADPASDMYAAVPVSVSDAFQVVDNYLYSEKINDCGVGPTPAAPTQTNLTWTYTATGSGCPGTGISIAINRGCSTVENGIYLIGTCVTVTYAYKWQFNSVSGLMPGKFLGPATITTTAAAFNEN
ncbi:MAG TPA: TadE/TadG family type IV pilus assembly protein [Candidatus Sulfotelmatobacter sp.]|nr:TadE/TadG family type IV pilus assembly protein [Candidatus Sulfotelmatobacter sp.]